MRKTKEEIGEQAEDDGARTVEKHIPRGGGSVGQEALVPLVAGCDQRGAQKGKCKILEVAGAGQRQPPSAQPCQGDEAIAQGKRILIAICNKGLRR